MNPYLKNLGGKKYGVKCIRGLKLFDKQNLLSFSDYGGRAFIKCLTSILVSARCNAIQCYYEPACWILFHSVITRSESDAVICCFVVPIVRLLRYTLNNGNYQSGLSRL